MSWDAFSSGNRGFAGLAVAVTVAFVSSASAEDWWICAQRGLAEAEYHASNNGRGLQAPNRAHDLRTYFEPGRVRLHSRTAAGSPALVSFSLTGIGRTAGLTPIAPGSVTNNGAWVAIRRPDVIEWYNNSARGLERCACKEATAREAESGGFGRMNGHLPTWNGPEALRFPSRAVVYARLLSRSYS